LQDYFPVVSFSSPDNIHRHQIVAKAKQDLEKKHGNLFNPHNTYVVGDTPSDIRAARTLGLVSVGVATGHYTLHELEQEKPDILLPDLYQLREKVENFIK
ncbi:MAG: HAD hydrolase-like protein, partial [Nanoarchaeota archaeon]|nr:HAD hydrolase-like protein [Nanoarchaeota archaeon]